MAATFEKQAIEFATQAEKKLKSFSLFNKRGKYEEAAEIYIKCANSWKRAKNWKEASDAFQKAGECHLIIDSKYDAATVYVKASHCCKKLNANEEAIKLLSNAVDLFSDENRFSMSAKYQKEIGELYEAMNELPKSIEALETAAEFFDGEGSSSAAHSCLLKVAHSAALIENYVKATEIFEKVATESVNNDLLKWSVKDYLFKAGICSLCMSDLVATKRALDKYCSISAEFSTTREYGLLKELVEAVEKFDADAFATASQEFHNIVKLDPWKTKLLVRVKDKIGKNDGEEDSDQLV
jgi:alpha-soluble NSF attachment protein